MAKVYTKTGDKGSTSLLTGRRVAKSDPLIEAYGSLDELQCHLGVAKALLINGELTGLITEIQEDVFTISAELSCDGKNELLKRYLDKADVARVETYIDNYTALYSLPKNFLMPGASQESAAIHVARAVCRRCERLVVGIDKQHSAFETVVVYLNRLSDLLFVLAWGLELESTVVAEVLKAVTEEK